MIRSKKFTPVAVAVLTLCGGAPAFAGEPIDFDNGMKLDWHADTTYTLSTRVKNADPVLVKNNGTNDGDNNFKKGALTSNNLGLLLNATLSKGDSGLVMSGSTFYNDVYHHSNDNTRPFVDQPGPVNEFTPAARRYHGGYSRLLDSYGYTAFNLGDTSSATVRAGRHVVSWGEALFFPGIAFTQGPADGTKVGIPGAETKDQLLPEDQVSTIIKINNRWSLLGQLQYNWHETLAPAPGSFLNTSDGVGPGGTCLSVYINNKCSFGLRGPDKKPKTFGQWGVGTRYRITDETELGLYYLNYKDRTPLPEINAFNSTYNVRYFDNVKLTGASLSTTFGIMTLAGELSYKQGAPVLVNTVVSPATRATVPNPTRADVTQLNINAFANFGRTAIADSMLLLGEIAAVNVSKVQAAKAPGVSALGAAAAFFPATNSLSFGQNSVAVTGQLVLGYPGITNDWDLTVPISYSQQLKGRSLVGGVGGQGDKRASIGATFTYKSNLQVGLTYLAYMGSPDVRLATNRLLTDRDTLSLVMKYSF